MVFDTYYWEDLCQGWEEIQEAQSPKVDQIKMSFVFVLNKDNSSKVVREFIYDMAPTTYYDRGGVLRIDEYKLVAIKDNKAYYEFVKPEKR